jgi:hypothetical protein
MARLLAPRRLWGCSRVLLALVFVAFGAQAARAQVPKKADSKAAPKADAGKAAPKADAGKGAAPAPADASQAAPVLPGTPEEQEQAGVVDLSQAKKAARVEMFLDPRAEDLLDPNKFQQFPRAGSAPGAREIKDMATGALNSNRDQIQRFVNAQFAILTNHTNLKAVTDPEGNATRIKEFESAAEALIEPLTMPQNAVNPAFRKDYVATLINTLPKLLKEHLHVRSEAMIILAMTGEPDAIPIFTAQLKDPNQVAMVKLWAAKGITNATQNGRRDINVAYANSAAKALSDFLQSESDTPWPVQWRALEALGCLRLPTDAQGQGKAEMASTAMRFLADPEAKPDVRAWAAWAIGLMKTAQVNRFNYNLVGYWIGQAAADLGAKVESSYSDSPAKATHLTSLLLYRLLGALRGDDTVRESGLMNSTTLGPSRKFLTDVTTRVQAVTVAAFNLTSPATPKNQLDSRKKELNAKVAALKEFLAQNKPSDSRLVPGGPEIPGLAARVAGGAAK